MVAPLVAGLVAVIPDILDKIFPDPAKAADAKLKFLEMQQTGELAVMANTTALAQGQNVTNQIEASSTRLFVAGGPPTCGWVCAASLFFKYIGGPMLVMICDVTGHTVRIPDIDDAMLMNLLLGMLGLGALRTAEKIKKVA